MKLSAHFTLAEMTASDTAERLPVLARQQEHPPASVVEALRYLCETTLEPLRLLVGYPLQVTSGYRCAELNRRVGGSSSSQHVLGEAADVKIDAQWLTTAHGQLLQRGVVDQVGDRALEWTAAGILFAVVAGRLAELDIDQVIHEYGLAVGQPAWVHIAASRRQSRRRVTLIGRYTSGRYIDYARGGRVTWP